MKKEEYIKTSGIYGYVPSTMDGTEAHFEGDKTMEIPEEYSYVPNMPPIWNQGQLPICVTEATAAFVNWNCNVDTGLDNATDIHVKLLEIYNQRSNKPSDGMTFKDALSFLKHTGVSTDKGIQKIERYALVGNIDDLKKALITNGPCVGALPVHNSSKSEFWLPEGRMEGGHAISIVGYNKDGFIIRNSWGEWFGDHGYVLLKYDQFKYFYEVWTIIA